VSGREIAESVAEAILGGAVNRRGGCGEGLVDLRLSETESAESGGYVVAAGCGCGCGGQGQLDLRLEVQDDAPGRLGADAGDFAEEVDGAADDGQAEVGGGEDGEESEGGAGADAGDGDQLLEEGQF